ncbi:TetR family transcriptional regulator [Iamia majanohamensis]|uniref:TetR family transcriptional regulator n=1 Tax=Iamia majanohamensis TaxID=467976 RepID=A0AAE9YAT7_9ACTN|nr:TetR family transcriptional regulator [Iamia majanohamensis]WCO67604.1 TetR family transcriptional regulator [Iamia majanohamensis]
MPSENVAPTVEPDRRTRKRRARRDALLALAADLVDERGLEGLTMAALAEAADYAPASLYTYFPSRSALLAALQQRALGVLGEVADDHRRRWDEVLAGAAPAPGALARLLAFSRLFLTAPQHHTREFRLQQRLLVTPDAEETADAAEVVPAAMAVLDVPRRLLAEAVAAGALAAEADAPDPIDRPLDEAVVRTLAWVVAMNGALLADELTTGLPTTGVHLGEHLTTSLLRGWGADPADLAAAAALAADLPLPPVP